MADERKPTGDRQAELVDAALELVATRGIAALTTRTLAAHVGLSSGAIFRHFESLDALLVAVVERVETVLEATYPPSSLPPVERLAAFVDARGGAVGRQVGILRLVLSEQFVLALPAGGSARLASAVRRSRSWVEATLREGQADGSIRDDLPAADLAVIVIGTIQALALLPAAARSRAETSERVRTSLLTLLRGRDPEPRPLAS